MLERISHFISGYVRFEYKGDSSRFMNLAARSGIMLWGFKKKNNCLYANIKAAEYKRLWGLKRRCGPGLKCVKKRGVPFYVNMAWKRKGMIIGFGIFIGLFTFLNSIIWSIEVNGLENITAAEVLSAAKESGVYEGGFRKGFDPDAAALEILEKLEGISWISINTEKSIVEIAIKEAEPKPELLNENAPSNIVAAKTGMILSVTAQSGMVMVEPGDIVMPGDILVSGEYTDEINEYTPKEGPVKTIRVVSRASVIAETARKFTIEIDKTELVNNDIGEQVNEYILFFGLKVPMGLNTTPTKDYRTYKEVQKATLLGKELPVGIYKEKYIYYEQISNELDADEMKKKAVYELRKQQNKEMPEGSKIVDESLEYEITDTGCILTAFCVCEEEIGRSEIISGGVLEDNSSLG